MHILLHLILSTHIQVYTPTEDVARMAVEEIEHVLKRMCVVLENNGLLLNLDSIQYSY